MTISFTTASCLQAGDKVMISGCLNREFGRSWPRWMTWTRLPLKARFALQTWTLKWFGRKFGPQLYTVSELKAGDTIYVG